MIGVISVALDHMVRADHGQSYPMGGPQEPPIRFVRSGGYRTGQGLGILPLLKFSYRSTVVNPATG
jgi:hypothetical protein